MVKLKKLGGGTIVLNERYIESIETSPDTTIKLHNGTTYLVQEKAQAIMNLISKWETKIRTKVK